MELYNKIYKALSIAIFIIHILLFFFILFCSFLPFKEGKNFYQYYDGSFFLLLLAACVFAFLSIKRPAFSLGTVFFTFAFFFFIEFHFILDASLFSLTSPWIGGSMPNYQDGFKFMARADRAEVLDFVFVIYSLITIFVRRYYLADK